MAQQHAQIFVNLPVKDLKKTMAFWQALGYEFNPQFTDENAASLVLGENLFAMLLTEPFFKTFTTKAIADSGSQVETLTCLACTSREEVDSLVAKARAAGGTVPREPQDHGFMYGHGFDDVDGHTWELVYMSGMPG